MSAHTRTIATTLAVVSLLAACGGSPSSSPTTAPTATVAPLPTGPILSATPGTATPPPTTANPTPSSAPTPAVVIPALEPASEVNSYYCVTQFDNGPDKDYLWITTVRDQAAQSMRYDRQRGDDYTSYFMTQIGDRQWEDVGQGYKASGTDTDLEQTARAFEVPALFTRFFIDTASLGGFSTGDELENASNIQSHVYRARDNAKVAMTADELIGAVTTAAYAVSADAGVLVEARFNGQSKTGDDLYLTLTCNQYDDPSQVITAP